MKLTNESVLAPWQHLSTSVQTELAELLDQYACQLEAGDEAAAQQLLLSHPDLSLHLHGHLESLQLLCRAAAQSRLTSSDAVRPLNASLGSSGRSRSKTPFLPDSHAPSVLGDYRIEREIGRGGMGIVYAATQLSLRRNVALKVLPFAAVLDQLQVARFRNEAQAAASLHHPHIVPVFAVGCERGVHYYSMQLIDGQTLEQVIKETSLQSEGASATPRPVLSAANVANDTTLELMRPMAAVAADSDSPFGYRAVPLADSTHVQLAGNASTVATIRNRNFVRATVELMICVAEALDYAHQIGVVHRDIKPSNLLLDATGKVWVADFGLAQCRGANHLTAHGNVVGTALYMSPEQIAAHPQEVDHRTDIYSFGITLYELLTLQRAYAETDREQLLKAIETKDPISLRWLNPAISIDLETIVFKAIAKQKSDRYTTAGELAEDLRRYLDGRPTLARRPTAVDRAFKWAMRRQRSVCAAVAISLIAMTGLAVSTLLVSRQSSLKDRANRRAQLHLDQAHHAVDRFSGLMAQQLKTIPGTDDLRAQLLREAEHYYLDFIEYAGQTPILETELAKVRFRLAAVYSQLAKFKDAEDQYQLAIAGIRSLPKPSKEEPAIQADLALCLHNLAALRKQQGRYEAALNDYQQAVGLQEPLLRYTARDSRFLREWASTQTNLATLLWACGDQTQAEQRFIRTQIELEDHLKRSPEDTTARKQLVECRNSRVAILRERDPALAERLLRSNVEELRSFGTTNDTRQALPHLGIPSTLCQLAVARNNLATLLGQRGDSTQAIDLMKASIQTLRSQADEAVNDSEIHQQLAIAHNNLGQLYWGQEPNQQSAHEFEQAEAILRPVLESSKADPDALSRLAGILHNRSIIEQHLGNLDGAMQHVAQAIEYQALAIKKAPLNAIYRRTLESHREQLDHVVEKLHAQNDGDRQTVEIKNTALPSSEDDNGEPVDPAKDRGGKYDAA